MTSSNLLSLVKFPCFIAFILLGAQVSPCVMYLQLATLIES